MMSNNKVLTVSYGTFSCTLEGFEDSFGAMKAVAEYFRDLAADDRFFGAEPPQPDAEMIAQIAARQSATQVEGRRDGDGYVLRAHDTAATSALSSTATEAPMQATVSAPETMAPQTELMEPEDPEENIFDTAALHADADSSMEATAFARAPSERVEENIFSDMDAEEDEEIILSATLTTNDAQADFDEDYDDAEVAETPSQHQAPRMAAPHPDIVPQPESIAAKLQRIRAVVADDAMVAETNYDEDEHAEDGEAQQVDPNLVAEATETASASFLTETNDAPDDASHDDARIAEVLANFSISAEAADHAEAPLVLSAEDAVSAPTDNFSMTDANFTSVAYDAAEAVSENPESTNEQATPAPQHTPLVAASTGTAALRLTNASAIAENDLDRLMAEADNQMDEPEGSDRRATFSQLRAAVAATNADDDIEEVQGLSDDAAYRHDLEQAVKPRRPVARAARTERPDLRPAPLQLVAEQRIDVNDRAAGPVKPRRVVPDAAPAADQASDFEDYAAERGATELPALLEAAASYLSFVEGMPQFSRPQLMSKVRQVKKEEFNREHGLRSFGQLLRIGKIEKIKGGRFTVSDDIGYRPEDQRAVG